jgi:hypothetical protein
MKIKDIIKKINDCKLYIEIKDRKTGASYGFYTKSDLIYNDKYNNYLIKAINSQYHNNKRLLVLEIDY